MKKLKVLAIGNSFSVDAMQYLYDIAKDDGIEEIVLGNLYIGGASLSMHMDQIKNDKSDYVYYKNTKGIWEENYDTKLIDGLVDESWDYISLQQASHYTGLIDTFNYNLTDLIDFVNLNKTNPAAKIIWHMTWAYQKGANHGGFAYYKDDQILMYHKIIDVVKQRLLPMNKFYMIIPSGSAIQNLRTSFLGDTLTRDGFHLSFGIGRYCASLCWFHQLTGHVIDNIKFKPDDVSDKDLLAIKKAVKAAVKAPFIVTNIGKEQS